MDVNNSPQRIDPDKLPRFIRKLRLDYDSHDYREDGVCLMEAVAWANGEKHSDAPKCVCPVLRNFGIALNDWGEYREGWDRQRQRLKSFIIPLLRNGRSSRSLRHKRAATLVMECARSLFKKASLRNELKKFPEGISRRDLLAVRAVLDGLNPDAKDLLDYQVEGVGGGSVSDVVCAIDDILTARRLRDYVVFAEDFCGSGYVLWALGDLASARRAYRRLLEMTE